MAQKSGYYMVNGDFPRHPDGSYVEICEYKNCRQPCEQGWVRCPNHIGKSYPELEKSRRMKQLLAMLKIK